ncbi:hypothetical protein ACFQZT_06370 [Paenibacillus sp. GCM10027628]|uniref:hypothetical protein n=1 Tax=Paenibacillus sp. GCM10027628 TaxID=3273413 RepID=UPI003638D2D6
MEQMSGLTWKIAAGTQNVTSATEEQLAFLQQNSVHANILINTAVKLQETVRQFRL